MFKAADRNIGWHGRAERPGTTYFYGVVGKVRTKAIRNADLSKEFSSGKKKLTPLVWSHGLITNSDWYCLLA